MKPQMADLERAALALLLVLIFGFGLFDHSLWSSNECREGAMIWDMVQSGTWVTPVLNGVPYLEKPPLLHWTGVVLCGIFGRVTEGLLRLPAALYGFGAVLVAYLFARRLDRPKAGLAAAFMCGTSALYIEYSKIVLTDTALAFMVMLSLYLFWRAYDVEKPTFTRYAVFVLVSALSFYAKGLLGPGFVWTSVGFFLLFRKRWKLLFLLSISFAVVLAVVLAPWVWFLWKTGGTDFLRIVFWDNQFGRFLTFSATDLPPDPYHVHKEPFYFYILNLPVRMLPWTFLVIPALIAWFRRNSTQKGELQTLLRFALVCMAAVLHASSAKVACYALPLFPIVFLMTGIWLEDSAAAHGYRLPDWAIGITAGLTVLLAIAIPTAYIGLFVGLIPTSLLNRYAHGMNPITAPGELTALAGCYAAALMLALSLFAVIAALRDLRHGQRARVVMGLPAFVAAVAILGGSLLAPAMEFQRSYKPFAELAKNEMAAGRKIALGNKEEKHIGAFIFYLQTRLPIVTTAEQAKEFLAQTGVRGAIIAKTDDVAALTRELLPSSYTVLGVDRSGRKSSQFRLIIAR